MRRRTLPGVTAVSIDIAREPVRATLVAAHGCAEKLRHTHSPSATLPHRENADAGGGRWRFVGATDK